MTQQSTLLEMKGVRKTFGSLVALDNVDLDVRRGEIHGLLGGNGAGKTTLMNVLFGLYKADAGSIQVDGRAVQIRSPRDALQHGIGMVHQQFLQINAFTVAENIVLGTNLANRPTMNLAQPRQRIRELSERFGLSLDPDARLETLPMGVRQRVEIVKALYRGVKVLILDEPTTMLTPQQVDDLFRSLRAMVEAGLSVIFITHKLREVLSVCERITVLRHGRSVVTLARENATEDQFVKAMVGDEMDVEHSMLFAHQGIEDQRVRVGERTLLRVQGLSVDDKEGTPVLKDWSFALHAGEVLGIAGVAGNGQHELAECLMGLRAPSRGTIALDGTDITRLPTADRLAGGIAYVPESRWDDGLLPKATVAQNLILGAQRQISGGNGIFLNLGAIRRTAADLITAFKIKTGGPDDTAANMSGGNIQRMMLARAFARDPKLLILHNPTQGLDIPSIEAIYTRLLDHQRRGMATLLISENLDELFLLCNQIAVIYRGQLIDMLERHEFDAYAVGRLMSGVRDDR